MRRLIGAAMIALPFAAAFITEGIFIGWWYVALGLATAVTVAGWVGLAVWLLVSTRGGK